MTTALDLITEFEGFCAKPYFCPAKKLTVGYGSTMWQGMPVTAAYPTIVNRKQAIEEVENTLEALVKRFEKTENWHKMNENQQQATLDLAYNVGFTACISSKFFLSLDPDQLDDWNKITVNGKKVTLTGLTKRRQAEKQLFLSKV